MVNVLFLSRGGFLGGSQRQLTYVVHNLEPGRYRPIVVCRQDGPFVKCLRGAGVETYVMPMRPWRTWPAALLRYGDARRLVRLARRRQVGLVHSSDLWLSGYLRYVAAKLGAPSVLHVRAPISPPQVRKHRCGRVTAVVAISARIGNDLVRAGISREKVTVIWDAVDLDRFHPRCAQAGVLRRDFPQAKGTLIGIVGRISEVKRQLDFVRAAKRIASAGLAEATFLVVGEVRKEEYHRQVRRFVEENGLGGRVVFAGRRDDMPEVLASLDVLVTLSGGSVMIEAMACGTPVISAGFTKPSESTIVQDGRTGLLVPSSDDGDLSAALARLIQDPPLRKEMGRASRLCAVAKFGHRELATATQQLYDRLLNA